MPDAGYREFIAESTQFYKSPISPQFMGMCKLAIGRMLKLGSQAVWVFPFFIWKSVVPQSSAPIEPGFLVKPTEYQSADPIAAVIGNNDYAVPCKRQPDRKIGAQRLPPTISAP